MQRSKHFFFSSLLLLSILLWWCSQQQEPIIQQNKSVACKWGVAISIAPRFKKDGTSVEYWREVLNKIHPEEIDHLSILSKGVKVDNLPEIATYHQNVDTSQFFTKDLLGRELKYGLFNDSPARVEWRAAVVTDFVRLVGYVSEKCNYVIWIEDDAELPSNWFTEVKKIVPAHSNWMFHLLFETGTVGVVINTKHAHSMLRYLTYRFDEGPLDWLLEWWAPYYQKLYPNIQPYVRYPIFGHAGAVSTLREANPRPVTLSNNNNTL